MSGYGNARAREAKAIDLEQFIVEAGQHRAFMDSDGKDTVIRRAALDALAAKRGTRVTASEDTWALVQTYLLDRFVGETP